jgi:hypothetical protein
MVIFQCDGGVVVSLDVEDPDEVTEILIEGLDGLVEGLTGAFSGGWYGMFGRYYELETSAVDLAIAAENFPPFKALNPVLTEGQEILDSFSYDSTLIY